MIKTVTDKGKRIDVGIVGYQGPAVRLAIKDATLALARSYHPRLLLPAHEDRAGDGYADMAVAPLVVAIREELPDVSMAEPVYRSPICFNVSTGSVFNQEADDCLSGGESVRCVLFATELPIGEAANPGTRDGWCR
jgi:hypothetical protein